LKHSILQYLCKFALMTFLFLIGVSIGYAANTKCQSTDGEVTRAMFTTQIENREPVNQVLILEDNYKSVYFYTDLRNLEGQDIVHRWEHEGHVVAEKVFSVKGPRWRVYSTQELDHSMLGRWTVVVTDKDGCPLKAVVFQYVASDPNGEGSAIIELK
jgi:hypothetical protein